MGFFSRIAQHLQHVVGNVVHHQPPALPTPPALPRLVFPPSPAFQSGAPTRVVGETRVTVDRPSRLMHKAA